MRRLASSGGTGLAKRTKRVAEDVTFVLLSPQSCAVKKDVNARRRCEFPPGFARDEDKKLDFRPPDSLELDGVKFLARRASSLSSLKRVTDVCLSVIFIVITLPVLLMLSMAVLLSFDKGPVIYRQIRIGRFGRPFACLKFRSMHVDADRLLDELLDGDPALHSEWHQTRKLRKDPRITVVGRFMRSTSLDELPQLWNTLVGDMSIVGPRPITQAELDGPYQQFGARQAYLSVRPGITGLWQISGRSTVSYERRIELDRQYISSMSPRKDMAILVRTVGAVVRRIGAC